MELKRELDEQGKYRWIKVENAPKKEIPISKEDKEKKEVEAIIDKVDSNKKKRKK